MAPIRAAEMIPLLIRDADITISPPIHLCNPVLTSWPQRVSAAVIIIAFLGSIAQVETDVGNGVRRIVEPLI